MNENQSIVGARSVGTTCKNTLGTYECVQRPISATRKSAHTTSTQHAKNMTKSPISSTPISATVAVTTTEGACVPAATRSQEPTTSKQHDTTKPRQTSSVTPTRKPEAVTTIEEIRVPAATTTARRSVAAAASTTNAATTGGYSTSSTGVQIFHYLTNITHHTTTVLYVSPNIAEGGRSVSRHSLLAVGISIAIIFAVAVGLTILYKRGYCGRVRELHQRSSTHLASVANNLYGVANCATPTAPPDTSMTYSHLLRQSLRQDYQVPSNQSTDYNRLFEMNLEGQVPAHQDIYYSEVTVDFETTKTMSTMKQATSTNSRAKPSSINEYEVSETVEPHLTQANPATSPAITVQQYEDVDKLLKSGAYSITQLVTIDDPPITKSHPLPATTRQPLITGPSEYLVPVDELHTCREGTF